MIKREMWEEHEYKTLSQYAAKAKESGGRLKDEEQCNIRTVYQRDRDRIIHSKALRRLMHKTQVFLSPEGDHFRTRLTHTLDVSQISRTIARALALNEDLTEAIAMGHDLGHTPFGHNGEEFLDNKHPGGFKHNVQSLRVVDVLEIRPDRQGMNLTFEVRDGILNHTGPKLPMTLEGQIVRFSDRIAYINHDIDDAIRAGVITSSDIPADCAGFLGLNHRTRIDTLVRDVITNSDNKDQTSMSSDGQLYMNKLRDFMFENVYKSKKVKKDNELEKIQNLIDALYDYYICNPSQLPAEQAAMIETYGINEIVKDYIAGMTDRYAINIYKDLFVPSGWR